MTVFLSVLGGLCVALMVLIEAVRPSRPQQSLFELRRRAEVKDRKAIELLRREELLAQASMLTAPLKALALVGLFLILLHLVDRGQAVLIAVVISLVHARIARLTLVRKLANKLYKRYEPRLLGILSDRQKVLGLITGKVRHNDRPEPIGSHEELIHLLKVSHIFSDEDKRLVEHALRFRHRQVGEIMTKKDNIVSVKDSELLGPLVLDDLHKSGQTIFPVTKGGAFVGTLDISDHAALRNKESVYVRDVMETSVGKISQNESLQKALEELLAARQQLLFVINDTNETVGMISLDDTVRALAGWKQR